MKIYENKVAVEVKTVEDFGFNHGIGMYSRLVKDTSNNEFVVVKYPGGAWRRWEIRDKIQFNHGGVKL